MNELHQAYCYGAAMAYRDVAGQLRGMIERASPELTPFMVAMEPMAVSCENKAKGIYEAAERWEREGQK